MRFGIFGNPSVPIEMRAERLDDRREGSAGTDTTEAFVGIPPPSVHLATISGEAGRDADAAYRIVPGT